MDKEISKFSRCIRREKYYKQLFKCNQLKKYINMNINMNINKKKDIYCLRNIVYVCSQTGKHMEN